MIFANYAGCVDVYMRVSSWEQDLWSHYQIVCQAMPEDWHKAQAMTWISNDIWPMDALPDKKRKHDEVEETIEEKEAMMHDECVYQTAIAAMTPAMHTASPTSES